MLFSNSKSISNLPSILTSQGMKIECVSKYRYLGVLIDESLYFSHHTQLAKRLKLKFGFYFRIKSCHLFKSRKRLVAAMFMSVLDYGDVLYMHASSQSLHALDTVYYGSLRFITGMKGLTHYSYFARDVTNTGWWARTAFSSNETQ